MQVRSKLMEFDLLHCELALDWLTLKKNLFHFFPSEMEKKIFKHLYNCCVLETDNLFFSHRSVDREMLPQDRVYPEFHLNLFEMRVS